MNWYDSNPNKSGSLIGNARWSAHQFGRQHFAGSFAKGGFASTAFAATSTDALVSPWRRKNKPGSQQYIDNLRKIQSAHPGNKKIAKSLTKAEQGVQKAGWKGKLLGVGMVATVALPMFTTPGSMYDKTKASVSMLGWDIGAAVGMKLGAGVGAAIGGPVGAVLGASAGYLAGGLTVSLGIDKAFNAADAAIDRERNKRQMNWVGNQAAFMTQGAHTMRQQSLQAMNRGMMSARSMLGREGMMLHQ